MKGCKFGRCSIFTLVLFTLCMIQIFRLDPNYKSFIFGTTITRLNLFLGIMITAIIYEIVKYYICNRKK